MTRGPMIGDIRSMYELLLEQGRFELLKEIMGEIDRFNFTGVSDYTVNRLHQQLTSTIHNYPAPIGREGVQA